MSGIEYPTRYRRLPRTPEEQAAYLAECNALVAEATALDGEQRALSNRLAGVRSKLAHLRVVIWPRVEPADIVRGFRHTRRDGPPPIPPVAQHAHPLHGKHLRSAVLALLAREQRPMTLVEIHRVLHLHGYAIESRFPVKRLADACGYETLTGRARRTSRGVYAIGELNPGTRRRLAAFPFPARRLQSSLPYQSANARSVSSS